MLYMVVEQTNGVLCTELNMLVNYYMKLQTENMLCRNRVFHFEKGSLIIALSLIIEHLYK